MKEVSLKYGKYISRRITVYMEIFLYMKECNSEFLFEKFSKWRKKKRGLISAENIYAAITFYYGNSEL